MPQFIASNFFNITEFNSVKLLDLKKIAERLESVAEENGFVIGWSRNEFDMMMARYGDMFNIVGDELTLHTIGMFYKNDIAVRTKYINDEFNFKIPEQIIFKTLDLIKEYAILKVEERNNYVKSNFSNT
jgi:hypothetical protein